MTQDAVKLLPYGPTSDGWIKDDGVSGALLNGRAFAQLISDIEIDKGLSDLSIEVEKK